MFVRPSRTRSGWHGRGRRAEISSGGEDRWRQPKTEPGEGLACCFFAARNGSDHHGHDWQDPVTAPKGGVKDACCRATFFSIERVVTLHATNAGKPDTVHTHSLARSGLAAPQGGQAGALTGQRHPEPAATASLRLPQGKTANSLAVLPSSRSSQPVQQASQGLIHVRGLLKQSLLLADHVVEQASVKAASSCLE